MPIVVNPAILKLALGLGCCLDSRDDLMTGLHAFILGQHSPAEQKRLKEVAARYDMVMGSVGAPSMADANILSAPDGLTLP